MIELCVVELQKSLSQFVEEETDKFYDEPTAEKLLQLFQLQDQSTVLNDLISEWNNVFTEVCYFSLLNTIHIFSLSVIIQVS